ncbi:MAG TPA: VanZ family protein [Candidatus Binatia bacterium]
MEQKLLGVGKTWAPVVAWMALMFTFSTDWFAAPNTSSFVGPLLSWLIPGIAAETTQIVHAALRKLGHWTEYFILATLLAAACKAQWPKQTWRNRFIVTVIIATLYAISDEWHQSFVPSRGASAIDVAIDAFGAICGAFWTLCCGRTCAIADKAQQVVKKT